MQFWRNIVIHCVQFLYLEGDMPMHSSLGLSVCHAYVSIHHARKNNTSIMERGTCRAVAVCVCVCVGGVFYCNHQVIVYFSVKVEDMVENVTQPYFLLLQRGTVYS